MQVVEIIPYRTFKERLQLVKKIKKEQKCNIEVFNHYLYVEVRA